MVSSSFLVFNCRMNTLGEIIENPEGGIKVITETMILNKEVEQNTSEKDFYNHVYYFNFKKLFPYLIPCEFREEPEEPEEYYFRPPKRPPVTLLEASIETTENKAGTINHNVACSKIFEQAKKIDYTNLVRKYFKYSKGHRKIYSLKYQNLDFSVSVSLWCSTHEERAPKEFVDFINSIFNSPLKKYNRVHEVEGYPIDDIPTKEELNIR